MTDKQAALSRVISHINEMKTSDGRILDSDSDTMFRADDVKIIIEALEAQIAGGWRPIVEAAAYKKTDDRILIPDNGGTVVYWEKDGNENQGGKPAWTCGYFDSHYEQNYVFHPKYFMLIPAAPEGVK